MSLLPQFRELGLEFSRLAKKEVESLKSNAKKIIESIETETQYKIRRDLQGLITEFQQKIDFEMKKQFSDRINEINLHILEMKTKNSQILTEKAITEIKNRKMKNPEGYWNYLMKSLDQLGELVQSDCWLLVNPEDLDLFKKNREFLMKKFPKLSVISNSVDFIGGFKVVAKDNQFEIDQTLKTKIQKQRNEISRIINASCSQCILQITDGT